MKRSLLVLMVTLAVLLGTMAGAGTAYATGEQGLTPGYWKNHVEAWPDGSRNPDLIITSGVYFDEVFEDVFPLFDLSAAGLELPHETLLSCLQQGGGGEKAFLRHAVAALLNSQTFDHAYSLYYVSWVVSKAYETGDFEPWKNILEQGNQAGP